MAIEVHVPNKSYEGYYGGVRFQKGVGIFEDEVLGKDLAERYQYEIIEIKKEVAESAAPQTAEKEVVEKPKRKRKPKAGE